MSLIRRDFIKKMSIGTIGLIVPNLISCNKNYPKITILGAGIAGLSAAYYLKKQGIIAQVYEAQSRFGGRILTGRNLVSKGITTEIGGEFIDSTHTDLLGFCKEFNLSLLDMLSPSEEKLIKTDFFFEGERRNNTEVIEEFKNYPQILSDIKLLESDNKKRIFELDKLSIDEYLHNCGMNNWLDTLLKNAFTSELGLDTDIQNCITMLKMISIDTVKNKFEIYGDSDERFKVIGGNERIIEELAKRVDGQINLDCVAEKISKVGNSYKVYFQNGSVFSSDIIIITLPFKALKNVKLDFEMPPIKRKCIDELDYGTQSKLFFGCKERFWRKENFSGYVLSDKIHNGWDSSEMQKENEGIGSYTIFLGGKKGIELSSNQYKYYLDELDKIYPGAKDNYTKHSFYNWTKNPYIQGAYSCYKVGQMTTIAGKEGQPVGNVFFAGEHCSENFGGFMNGGVETAKNVVKIILKSIHK